ncbi:MAG: nucleotidyltransferase domain-containing protein [Alphaproteobacteria bacterium]|jgi:predicted nucleotidyltransferase|nr:nucleotidyltransferase domain-containing protein [Alphaproteobacteria bacterium]MDP7427202.1 nucleotidyltransferase domain-containing protein [Alphaproteobacteria bacterium]
MQMNAPLDEILAQLRHRLEELLGERLQRMILFGSRARGHAEDDADIDILAVVCDHPTREAYGKPVTQIVCDLSLQYDTVISCFLTTPESVDQSGLPFYRNVRREGIAL